MFTFRQNHGMMTVTLDLSVTSKASPWREQRLKHGWEKSMSQRRRPGWCPERPNLTASTCRQQRAQQPRACSEASLSRNQPIQGGSK